MWFIFGGQLAALSSAYLFHLTPQIPHILVHTTIKSNASSIYSHFALYMWTQNFAEVSTNDKARRNG
jgi:hypothetical protein